MDRNQTIHRGETGSVRCNAYPGDPPEELLWLRPNDEGQIFTNAHIRVDDENQALVIENVSEDDAGIYECAFNLITGVIKVAITVNVIDPPDDVEAVFNPDLPRNLSVSFGDPLRLECRNERANPSFHFSWIIDDDDRRIEGHVLELQPEEVISGVYRCLVHRDGTGLRYQHTVTVTLVHIPPRLLHPHQTAVMSAIERKPYFLNVNFGYRLDRSNVRIEWKDIRNGRVRTFGRRFMFDVSRDLLRLNVNRAALTDRGQYLVNISNDYGYAELRVDIRVESLEKTPVQVRIAAHDISCSLVEVRYSPWCSP